MLAGSEPPSSSQIFNIPIPLDAHSIGSLSVSQTTPLVNVARGQLVPYTITANNHSGQVLSDVSIVDRLPAGFSDIKGSALVAGVPSQAAVAGRTLSWDGLVMGGQQLRQVEAPLGVWARASQGGYGTRAGT